MKRFSVRDKNGKKGKAKRLKLGRAQFQIGTGALDTLTIKLSRKALAELANLVSVKVLTAVVDQDAQSNHSSSSRKTRLKLAKSKHRT